MSQQQRRRDRWKKVQRERRCVARARANRARLAELQAHTTESTSVRSDNARLPHGFWSPSTFGVEANGKKLQEWQLQEQQQQRQQQLFGGSVVHQAVPLQGDTAPLEHLGTGARAFVDRTVNATETAELKQMVPKFSRAIGTKVSANCPALHFEAAMSNDLQILQPLGSGGASVSKQNLGVSPDEPCWLLYSYSTMGPKTSPKLCRWHL